MREIKHKLDFIKMKISILQESTKRISRELEGMPQSGSRYLQKTYLIKDFYPKYTNTKLYNRKMKNSL